MNDFELTVMKLSEEATEIQKTEIELRTKAQMFNQKLMGFFKEQGLPDDFTLPQLVLLAIRKSRA